MTRLLTTDIEEIGSRLPEHDSYLESVTNLSLAALARQAAGCDVTGDASLTTFCVVPISTGLGVIPHFSRTVRDILVHIGFDAHVSPERDDQGLAYARDLGVTATLFADDTRFVAKMAHGETICNTEATARGYVTGLDAMARGVSNTGVLLLGCGPLGHAMAEYLLALNARVSVFDLVPRRARGLAARAGVVTVSSLEQEWLRHDLIVDATNSPATIDERHVSSRTCVAAPGMPCGTTPAAKKRLSGRLLHDPLQIGVATMAFMAHQRNSTGRERP